MKVQLHFKSGATPKFFRPRPVPYALHARVKTELDRLETEGVLKKTNHRDWAAPVVVVNKPDGGIRICGDYKVTINSQLQIDQYPLPRVEDIFAGLQGSNYFTKLDLSRAYLQMELDEESQKYTTIYTHPGIVPVYASPFRGSLPSGDFPKIHGKSTA